MRGGGGTASAQAHPGHSEPRERCPLSPCVDVTGGDALCQPGRFSHPEATLVTSPERCPGTESKPQTREDGEGLGSGRGS